MCAMERWAYELTQNVQLQHIKLYYHPIIFFKLQIISSQPQFHFVLNQSEQLLLLPISLLFKFRLMIIKTKSSQDSVVRETQRQLNGNINRHNKSKELREPRKKTQCAPYQLNSITSISSKRLHKPSKSTIEATENLHYNSPISAYPMNENIHSNAFSFTHILQQNMKIQQSQSNIECSLPPAVTSFQLNEPRSISIALTSRNDKRSSAGIHDHKNLKNRSISRENIYTQRDSQIHKKCSMEKSQSKSPLRVVNPNKINNTPKLKEYRKQRDEEKTFKNILESKENEEIRLQCSQKIFKYLQSFQNKSLNKKEIVDGQKSKSNLLSTGIISLSQRLDHEKIASELFKTSNDISNKSIMESSYNQQTKQFFEEDSSQSFQVEYHDQIKQLKYKVIQVNHQIQNLYRKDCSQNFQDLLAKYQNPQANIYKNTSMIQKLASIKMIILETVEKIVENASKLSKIVIDDIDQYMANIESSQKTKIDWNSIEEKMHYGDYLQALHFRNDILMERIEKLQSSLEQNLDSQRNKTISKPIKEKLIAELKDIKQKIQNIQTTNKRMTALECKFNQGLYSEYLLSIDEQIKKLNKTICEGQTITK